MMYNDTAMGYSRQEQMLHAQKRAYSDQELSMRSNQEAERMYSNQEAARGADIRNSGVPYQLQAMEKNMAYLADTISMLHAKLNPIMRPQVETAKDDSNRALGDSELSSFLARANLTVEEQTRRLNCLIQGVDL